MVMSEFIKNLDVTFKLFLLKDVDFTLLLKAAEVKKFNSQQLKERTNYFFF
jgi:hypothetical protein